MATLTVYIPDDTVDRYEGEKFSIKKQKVREILSLKVAEMLKSGEI